ncbi:anchored repeat ABC transporter, substrate-binding protein [Streptomyces sp. PTY087I2]|uniref:anchored repeat ABC transporter, substrate-binding protein n=1 Tax=Streptomyces sp. PTY087I2 TaxID=1819298 RepID=UPI0008288C69|nr:anchored repeat ABC transporter, substrate-binding protein [Streptomyces sp. PTY087I2]OCC14005.1 Manganese ABC transporter substrate-binding lipoprotein precursor [Streptomyces sp. PTY087I2]
MLSAAAAVLAMLVSGCGGMSSPQDEEEEVRVVTTTGILADLARNVGGERVDVKALVPEGGDPHSYEPSLRDVRDIVYADAAFSNYLMLEEQNLIRALDANLRADVVNISLAERAVKYAAEIIPLVEHVNLDTIWLGLRVKGTGAELGADRSSEVRLKATGLDGPGDLIGYLTETFGEPSVYFDSSDGFDAGDGYRKDTAVLPPDAHTHMSWAFTRPGVYRLQLAAEAVPTPQTKPVPLGEATFTFAVGVDPHTVPGMADATVLDGGHADITTDLDRATGKGPGSLYLYADPEGGGDARQEIHDPSRTVIEVPNKARTEVPGDPRFRLLGRAGTSIHQLPQAVLGRHVHGEIDPHLWQNVRNAIAYVKIIRDTLIDIDPEYAITYRRNAERYIGELEKLDAYMAETIAEIPESRRYLVTTHDAFGYLGEAYGIDIAGFVTPNPATEPSLTERRKLSETISNLHVPAVFLEPNLRSRSSTLVQVAKEKSVEVCPIYGDAFDQHVTSYTEMMRANADSLRTCLGGTTSKRMSK